jgi:hypothetical protein
MNLKEVHNRLSGSIVLLTLNIGFTGTRAQLWLDSAGVESRSLSFENHEKYSKSTKAKFKTAGGFR